MTLKTFALIVNTHKPEAERALVRIESYLTGAGLTLTEEGPDLVVSLGGDGTMLRAARVAHETDALLLGVNLGTLGYLTEVDLKDAGDALEGVLAGSFTVEERMLLQATATEPGIFEPQVGLNEVLVERSGTHRLVRLRVKIGGEELAAFNSDGVIVASPTGSTAYALSAGGPIVSPRAECLVVVPVSPHMLTSRPFILPSDEVVEVSVDRDRASASLSLDGRSVAELTPGSGVSIKRHPRPLRLARFSGPGFIERLRTKLGLPG